MTKKKQKNNSKNILNLFICLIIVLSVYFGYKGILLSKIHSNDAIINNYIKLRKNTTFDEPIEISYKSPEDVFSFEDLQMTNFLLEYEEKGNTYTYGDKTFRIVKTKGLLNDLNLKGVDKYLKKYNIKTDEDVYKYMLSFKKGDVNILSSYSELKDELFRRNFLVITSISFDKFHLLNGSIEGYLVIGKNINAVIKNGNDYYELYFYNYEDIDEVIDIISTISFT